MKQAVIRGEDMEQKNYRTSQLITVYYRKKSKEYDTYGYKYAKFVGLHHLGVRILAFCCDISILLLPIFIWLLAMLLVIANILPIGVLEIVQMVTFVLLLISVVLFPFIISKITDGNTFGRAIFDLKIVAKDKRRISVKKAAMREILGYGICVLVMLVVSSVSNVLVKFGLNIDMSSKVFTVALFAVIGYIVLNILCILLLPRHVAIIDLLMGTRLVILNSKTVPSKETSQVKEKKQRYVSNIDLHMHSSFSEDGSYNVEEIFQMAKSRGMKIISITDHNSTKANVIADKMSGLYDIAYIPGIEIDCTYEGHDMHVLGYFITYTSELYSHIENENLVQERKASFERVRLFEEFSGMKLDTDALLSKNRRQIITGEMIAEQLLNDPQYRSHELLKPYRDGGERSDMPYVNFYWDFFASGKPCHAAVKYPKLEDIIEVIKLTDGVPVIAHPYQTFREDISFVHKLIDKGIEGIEVFSSYHSEKEMAELLKIAKERKVFVTAGSDFHGKTKPGLEIGETNCPPAGLRLVKNFLECH
jgi:predicted metal-dependent phosphoesterase TrpH/uncharacterized RDD family membrane protein YckC